jgi:hypothetical protein
MIGKNSHSLRLAAVFAWLLAAAPSLHSATVWNGPLFTYNQPSPDPTQAANQDRLTPDVWLTRAASKGLFNAFSETNATALSPANTEWAFGTLTNFDSLAYTNWLAWLNGLSPVTLVGQPVVVHLISDDIYLSLEFTLWVGGGSGGFAYQRSTPPPVAVNLTHPADGAVLAAPATVNLAASAAATAGTVTNVQFFANGAAFGSVGAAPFNLASGPLAAGSYALAAVATASGISATSAVVNVSVVNPVAVLLSGAGVQAGQFTFNYAANAGLAYVIQSSTNLMNWVSLATNVAPGSPAPFSDPLNPAGPRFYRVGRLPNQ